MLKGFKDFILKGNVVELATAVIIGAAFTTIVTSFTEGIVQPLINSIPIGTDAADGLGFHITGDTAATFVNIGGVITAIINFLIVAAVVYFIIIVPYNKLADLGGFGKKSEVTEVALLAEIRDLLDPEGASKAKAEAEEALPDHLTDPAGPPAGATQRIVTTPPPAGPPSAPQPPLGGQLPPQGPGAPGLGQPYPTPQPAPGSYPPPGNYPQPGNPQPGNYQPGQYPPGEYPGDLPEGPGRHSR